MKMNALAASVVVALLGAGADVAAAQHTGLSRPGVCVREGAKIAGTKPVEVGSRLPAPRKVRDVKPDYPELPLNAIATGMWVGELLIGNDGKVSRLWSTREVTITPPYPAFNDAIVDAVSKWEFEPVVSGSRPVPACLAVTVPVLQR